MRLERAAIWVQTWRGLLCLFALGLAVRLVLAATTNGLFFDVSLFRQWSDRLVARGPSLFYEPGYFVDYPPGYLYVLLVLGHASRVLTGGAPPVPLLKLPAILADLGVAVIAVLLAARMSRGDSARWPGIRAAAAAAILLNPGLILVSAVWGQVDSILALLVMAGLYVLSAGRPRIAGEAAGILLLAVVIATKPQAVFALPVVAVVLIHRHLVDRRSGPARWLNASARIGLLLVLGYAVIAVMFGPFGVGPRDIPGFYRNSGSVYPFTSLWAFNLWGVAGFYRPDVGPGAVAIGGVAAFYAGLIALAAFTIALAVRAWRTLTSGVDATAVAMFGVVAVTCAAFALLTRSHERYLYLAVAGLAPFVGIRPFRWALATLSALYLLNVHFVYVFFSQHSIPPGGAWTIQPLYDAIFGTTREAWQLKVLSAMTATACLVVACLGWRWLDGCATATRWEGSRIVPGPARGTARAAPLGRAV